MTCQAVWKHCLKRIFTGEYFNLNSTVKELHLVSTEMRHGKSLIDLSRSEHKIYFLRISAVLSVEYEVKKINITFTYAFTALGHC